MKYPAFINDVPKIKLYSEIVYEDCIAERQLSGFSGNAGQSCRLDLTSYLAHRLTRKLSLSYFSHYIID